MSPNTLTPSQPYTLSYFITDPNDNATYYVRAVVYDAITGEVLDTKNLTALSTNPHLFTVRTQAPGDSSGHGRRIVVVATAYEDSGYTTKSPIYQEQSENYIVIKPGAGLTLGGGGVDWPLVKEMIVEEVGKATKVCAGMMTKINSISIAVSKIPTTPVKLTPILDKLGELVTSISKIPTDGNIDFSPIFSRIEMVMRAIEEKGIAEKTEIKTVLDIIDDLKGEVNTNYTETKDVIDFGFSGLREFIPKVLDKKSKSITFVLNEAQEIKSESENPIVDKKRDIMELM